MNTSPRFGIRIDWIVVLLMLVSLVILPGCDDDEIEVYDAPRPAVSSDIPANDPHAGMDMSQAQPTPQAQAPSQLTYALPEGWKETQPGRMILHKFIASSGATVTITAFPGDVGGTVANVNRWRGQLGMSPADEAQITSSLKSDKLDGHDTNRVDLSNDTQRLVVSFGMIQGKTWFFKLFGTKEQIDQAMAGFGTFLSSVKWQ